MTQKGVNRALLVSCIGAVCGPSFLFVTVFVLGLDQPSMDGRRGGIGTFIQWFNTPFVSLLDWVTKRNLMASDNLLVGSIGYLIYYLMLKKQPNERNQSLGTHEAPLRAGRQ